jgi:hypothetical protein
VIGMNEPGIGSNVQSDAMKAVPTATEPGKGKLSEWLKDGGVAITILGLLLYTLFAIPTTFFYGLLGISPAEVGISYTRLLTNSTLGSAAIVLSLGYIGYFIVIFGHYIRITSVKTTVEKDPRPRRPDWDLDDQEFEVRVSRRRAIYSRYPEIGDSLKSTWGEYEPNIRRRRELRKKEKLTPDELSELNSIQHQIQRYGTNAHNNAIRAWLRRYRWWLAVLYPAVLAVLSAVAIVTAIHVLDGDNNGSTFGLFGYRADLVSVCPASKADAGLYTWLANRQIYLLGETAQDAVLYLSSDQSTVRVPITAVIISHGNCKG